MTHRNKAEFFDLDLYKKSLRFCISHILKSGGDENEARDVLHDSIERFLSKCNDNNFIFTHEPSYLLYGIIKNTWKEYQRQKKLFLNENFLPHDNLDDGMFNIQKKLKLEKHYEIFNRCLEKLSPRCVKTLKLYLKGFGTKELLDKLELNNRGVLDDKLYRCKKKLKLIMLEDEEYNELLKDG